MTPNNKVLERALKYQELGWSVFPVRKDKRPLIRWMGYQKERATLEQLNEWSRQYPGMNIGVATGALSGIVVLDLDIKHGWSSKKLREQGYNLPPTAAARTGNGGEHLFFKHPGSKIPNSEGQLFGDGVDIRGDGGFVVLAPSVTAYKDKDGKDAGGPYEWIVPPEDGIADMPEWLLAKIAGGEENKKDWRVLINEDAKEGSRNGAAASIAGGLMSTTGAEQWEIIAWPRLQTWNQEHCKPALPEKELRNVYESIVSTEQRKREDPPEAEEKKIPQKMLLMKLVTSNPDIELFRDNYGNGHAHVVVDNHKEIMVCKGRRFKQWLSHSYMEQYGDIADSKALNDAIHAIESLAAFKGKEYKLYNRVAKVGDVIWLDLADERNRAVKITTAGWNIVDEPPILFRRHVHQSAQVEPQSGGDIKKLFEFINVKDSEQKLLLLVYLVACFIPDFPHTLLYIHGQQGSAKSTLSRILRRLVDPSRTEVLHMPRDERELKLQLSRNHLVFYENVDGISNSISTVLCIGVTGGSSSERLYFTNGEDFIFDFQLNIGINGINISAVKPDLLERSLLFGLKPVEESERRDEAEIFEGFEESRSKILGVILDVAVKALAIRPSVTLTKKPRMADFALWGVAIAQALGYTKEKFLGAYVAKIREQGEEALAQSPEAAALLTFMKDRTGWKGTASELLNELSFVDVKIGSDSQHQRVGAQQLPKASQVLMRRLNELIPNLRNVGIEFNSNMKEGGVRIIVIRKIGVNTVQSVPTAPLAQPKVKSVDEIWDDIVPATPLPSPIDPKPSPKVDKDGVVDESTQDEIPF